MNTADHDERSAAAPPRRGEDTRTRQTNEGLSIPQDARAFLTGGGEMGERIRAFDWSKTPLGPPENWPQSLRSAVSILLPSKAQIVLFWGTDLTTLYNDAYSPVLGGKHPHVLGLPAGETWRELWVGSGREGSGLRDLFEGVLETGEAFWASDRLFVMKRFGYTEETYFDVSYDPVRDETGAVGGVFCIVSETTSRVIGERRLKTLRDLGAGTTEQTESVEAACHAAAAVLARNTHDFSFSLIYLLDSECKVAQLTGFSGLEDTSAAALAQIEMTASRRGSNGWPLGAVMETGRAATVADLMERFGELPGGVWSEPTHTALVLPMTRSGQEGLAGFFIAGVSPRRALDETYRDFLNLVAGHIATAMGNARAYEEERKRAEALAEIDHAKTAFFSNVSHEFRTPLTLMLGPLEDALANAHGILPKGAAAELTVAHRNSLRLLKLVNTMLDFSRIEAGRIRANYEETDLAAYTTALASNFRSACQRAGLSLTIDCPALPDDAPPAHVDRDMWEKIVLNLISNAFKFTLEGEIEVILDAVDGQARLTVRDTGVGIPADELPRMFERFHRVKRSQGRTHEGTGIGLALVQELVKLHGGTVRVESVLNEGSTFTVNIPLGQAHLDPQRIGTPSELSSTGIASSAFVEEALRWLPDADGSAQADQTFSPVLAISDREIPDAEIRADGDSARILWADDNADMREYVSRLLRVGGRFDVQAVPDGQAALEAARADLPELVLADVMMPRLDGFGLLRELRADPRLRGIPVILLSARAGEESRIEGLEAGADDYLIKPFSARELVARVESHIKLARFRREADQALREVNQALLVSSVHQQELTEVADKARDEAQQNAAALRESEERFRMIADNMHQLAWTCDELGNVTWYNRRWLDYTGLSFDDMKGWDWSKVQHPDHLDRVVTSVKRSAETGEPWEDTFPLRGKDGSYHWFLSRAQPIRDEQGNIVQWFGTNTDVEDLKQAREAAEAANRVKDEFLATVSHELRTPLNAIMGWTHLLTRSKLDEQTSARGLETIARNASAQNQLISDLLDVSRIISGQLRFESSVVDLMPVIEAATETVRPAADAKGIDLQLKLDQGAGLVSGDGMRLQQIVWNLLSNAVKFTPRGGQVTVRLKRENTSVGIIVTDTGEGISAEFLPYIFDRFRQAESTTTRRHGGLGLGLAIVRHLVEAHGGTIRASSKGVGKGATVTVTLPLLAVHRDGIDSERAFFSEGSTAAASSAILKGLRVLVIDDEEDARELLTIALTQSGAEVRTAATVRAALDLLDQWQPNVLVSDIGMPGADGYDLIRAVRALESERGGTVPALALTGYASAEDAARARVAGYQIHMAKPVAPSDLVVAVASLAAEASVRAPKYPTAT